MNIIPGIEFKKDKFPIIDSNSASYELPFYKNSTYFADIDNFVSFVKATEKLIRTSTFYSGYIKYLKKDIGLNTCQVLSNITDDDEVDIEMHHGPILTLFDYVTIIIDYLIFNNRRINSYIVADIILEEHFNNLIQVVMLTKTVHQQVHINNIFINLRQAFGDLNSFIKKYKKGLHKEHISKINKYIEASEKYDSFDKNVLELKENIKRWGKYSE